MKRTIAIALALAATLAAQSIDQLKLDHLKAKAKDHTELTLDAGALGLAGSAMQGEDAKVKAMLSGLKGIVVRSFEFAREGEYTEADVEQMRRLFQGPGWKRTVGIVSKADRESFEIFAKVVDGKGSGMGLVAAEPKELTLVYFDGVVDMSQLGGLAERFGFSAAKKKGSK